MVGDRGRTDETDTGTESETEPDGTSSGQPLAKMPPSAKLVYIVLEREGALSTADLAAETRLEAVTVRRQTTALENAGYIDSYWNPLNATEKVHEIADRDQPTAGDRHG